MYKIIYPVKLHHLLTSTYLYINEKFSLWKCVRFSLFLSTSKKALFPGWKKKKKSDAETIV